MTILRRSLLKAALIAPIMSPKSSLPRKKQPLPHHGTWAVDTGPGVFMSANNVPNLPANGQMFLGSYWYWHTTAVTADVGQPLLRAGRLLSGGDSGQFFTMDHNWNGWPCLQLGISGPLLQQPPYQYDNWFWSGPIPTGNVGYNNIIFAIDSTGQNGPAFLLNGSPINGHTNAGTAYSPTITAEMLGHPVWHLASGLGGSQNATPQYPFLGRIAEFVLFDLGGTWIDPSSVVSSFYDRNSETPPDWGSLDITGNAFIPGLTPILYFSGPPQSYVHNLHAGTNTGGRLTADPNQTFAVTGTLLAPPSDPWGFGGS